MTKTNVLGQQRFVSREDVEPVLFPSSYAMLAQFPQDKRCYWGKWCQEPTDNLFFSSLLLAVCVGEKSSVSANTDIRGQLLSQEMGVGIQHLSKFILILKISAGHCHLILLLFFRYFALFAYSFGDVYTQIIPFSHRRSDMPLLIMPL